MARPRDSRSPSPAGSHAARRRKDDDRRDRDHRRRSRSPDRRYRDRERDHGRDGRDRDSYRRRDRSIDRRDDDYYRGGRRDGGGNRDRRWSRDRGPDRARSPDRRGQRSGDGNRDYRGRRDDSRDRRNRRDGSTDSAARRGEGARARPPKPDGVVRKDSEEPQPAKSTPTQAQTEAEKKAERLRKLQAMKEKHAQKEAKEAAVTAGSTRMLLAEMDQKASGTPGPNSPVAGAMGPAPTSPAPPMPYAGKFDPKAIAKSSKAARPQSPTRLGDVKLAAPAPKPLGLKKEANLKGAGLLPANRAVSAFGFNKSADSQKSSTKRKIDMDDEEVIKRKLVKLPDFIPENADSTPDAEGEGEEEADDLDLLMAQNEEEMAEAHRVLQERRDERIQKEGMAMDVDTETPNGETKDEAENEANVESKDEAVLPAPSMDVDEDVDPLDAFMADLEQTGSAGGIGSVPARQKQKAGKGFEPEAYFSDDDYGYEEDKADPSSILAMASKKKKKDIPTIDYSKIELNQIRKNFWVEPQELSQMTEDDIADLRLELDGIKVSGKNVPKPVQKWSQCGLTRPILDVVEGLGYEKPTSIQMQALPVIMSGRDVIGVAKTGSGKTMAFVLPMLRHIKDQDPVTGDDGAIALIMTPTRELCTQIYSDLLPFAKALKLRAIAAYGGNAIKDQIAELKRGAEIIVATPGRMIDLLAANSGRVTNLKRATYLVLDEADRMFDMGFEPQVMKIFNNVRPDRQTILFSATMPRIIDALTKKVLREPVEIQVGGRSVVAPEITQIVEILDEGKKFVRLLELLGELYADDDDVRALIFVERQEKADDLLREVLRRGYGCMSIHGGKDQEDRNSTISDFKKGVCPIMIATSVAARGLDVKQLKLVVNYDAPNHLEDYVHRAGRTGRAGNTGTAVTFITEEQENCAPGIAKALEQSGQPVPEQLNEMRKAWKEKVKTGKAKDASGFGGKGLERLDKEREAARVRERKTHKAEGEEDDFKEEETAEDAAKKDKAKSAILAAASAIVSRESAKADASEAKPLPAAAEGAVKGGVTVNAGKGGALDKAASAISEINARLARAGQLRPGQPIDNKGPDAGAFHATLEINDFPQKARWAVTNRTNVAKILEATSTSITTKGNYYPPGKEPPSGSDPKLYILIEGDTELAVGKALSELTRLLREGTIAAADAESRAPVSGRYTIA